MNLCNLVNLVNHVYLVWVGARGGMFGKGSVLEEGITKIQDVGTVLVLLDESVDNPGLFLTHLAGALARLFVHIKNILRQFAVLLEIIELDTLQAVPGLCWRWIRGRWPLLGDTCVRYGGRLGNRSWFLQLERGALDIWTMTLSTVNVIDKRCYIQTVL